MLWLFIVLFVVILSIAIIIFIGYSISAPKYQGPPTDHFDGKKFKNANNQVAKGLLDVLKWQLNRDKGPWRKYYEMPYGSPPPAKVTGNEVQVTFINHSTFLIQLGGVNILTDPVWSERVSPFPWVGPKRMRPPGIRFEDLPHIDVILLTHNHYDHLDIDTVKQLAEKYSPQFYTPLGVNLYLEQNHIANITSMDWWSATDLNQNLKLFCVPAQHFSGRGMFDRDATLWCGFVIKIGESHLYFAGDSGYGALFKKIGEQFNPIKLAILPIGAYRPKNFMSPIHVSPKESVKIHLDVRAEQSIAGHFGTFPLADDGMEEPVSDLKQALKEMDIAKKSFWILQEGKGKNFLIQ